MDVKKKLKVSEFFNLVLYRSYRLAIFYLSIFLEITTIIRMQAQYGFSYLQIIYIISYCTSCTEDQQVCYTYTGDYIPADTVDTNDEWQSIIFISNIPDYLTLENTYIVRTFQTNYIIFTV
jgi:hypothetical protein